MTDIVGFRNIKPRIVHSGRATDGLTLRPAALPEPREGGGRFILNRKGRCCRMAAERTNGCTTLSQPDISFENDEHQPDIQNRDVRGEQHPISHEAGSSEAHEPEQNGNCDSFRAQFAEDRAGAKQDPEALQGSRRQQVHRNASRNDERSG